MIHSLVQKTPFEKPYLNIIGGHLRHRTQPGITCRQYDAVYTYITDWRYELRAIYVEEEWHDCK